MAADPTRLSRLALLDAAIPLVRLFAPEHGLSSAAADGTSVSDQTDPRTGLPVYSLYGERVRPSTESLRDLDVVLFDIPDVGARFYTYSSTLYHMMAACAEAHLPLIVLDRPNPLGGDLTNAEGPLLDPACRSFVGEAVIPLRHQLTLGELARLWNRERFPTASLRVIPCEGWSRRMTWPDTGLPWVTTSPAMPTFASVRGYPVTGIFEATNLSVGRGTARPFQLVGAPWLESDRVVRRLATWAMRGVEFAATTFLPTSSRYQGEWCQGVELRIADAGTRHSVAAGMLLLASIVGTHREAFQWATYPTAANPTGEGHFERLCGRRDIRPVFDARPDTIDLDTVHEWTSTGDWTERVQEVLLYR